MRPSFKSAYLEAYNFMEELGVFMYDTKINGPGMSISIYHGTPKRIICIDGSLPYKKRLFILMHEIGHIFYLKKMKLVVRKVPGSERQANRTVVRLLELFDKDNKKALANEFARYYNSTARGTHRAQFYP